jgi:hypothetical protein
MAFCQNKFCNECVKKTMHTNGDCDICKARKAREHKEVYFARLDKITLEERVRELEINAYARFIEPASFDWSQIPIG